MGKDQNGGPYAARRFGAFVGYLYYLLDGAHSGKNVLATIFDVCPLVM
jgi:hypothetical protein